jgi:hypothetical protein
MNHWCTGEDSNLRTSLGGTDLQSVGFNHSPTCAKTAELSAPAINGIGAWTERTVSGRSAKAEKQRSAQKCNCTPTPHLENVPNGVLLEKICYAAAPRKMPEFRNRSNAGAGEGI